MTGESKGAWRIWGAGALAALMFLTAYAVFVLTPTGQRWENAGLTGRLQRESAAAARAAGDALGRITVGSLAVAILVIVVIGLLRRRYALTVAAVGTVGGSLLLAEVLKGRLLPRPDLAAEPEHPAHNSFPSGHTTIATSVLFALVLVVPHRLRGVAFWIAYGYALCVGRHTVAAGWHRPSDVLGAHLLVLAVSCGFVGWLVHRGHRPPAAPPRPSPPRAAYALYALLVVAPLAGVSLVGLGAGAVLLLRSLYGLDASDPHLAQLAYQGGHALTAGMSAAVALVFMALVRRLDEAVAPEYAVS